jgi:hypothetical protein
MICRAPAAEVAGGQASANKIGTCRQDERRFGDVRRHRRFYAHRGLWLPLIAFRMMGSRWLAMALS